MITIVSSGLGNVNSVSNILRRIGRISKIADSPDDIINASSLILPGVGSFDSGIRKLHDTGFFEAIHYSVSAKHTPILGICLGMQMLMESSEEGSLPGFGFIPGTIKRLPNEILNLKVPHMGWNKVNWFHNSFACNCKNNRFYFVHSFCAHPNDLNHRIGSTLYGLDFASAVQRENITGFQFHPEKSHINGFELLNAYFNSIYL